MFLKTVWDSHGVFYFRSRVLSFKQSIKKFELIQKSYVPRALCFSCQGPSRLREAKRAMGTRMLVSWIFGRLGRENLFSGNKERSLGLVCQSLRCALSSCESPKSPLFFWSAPRTRTLAKSDGKVRDSRTCPPTTILHLLDHPLCIASPRSNV